MSSPNQVLVFGVTSTAMCVLGAVAFAYAPGDNKQAINALLGTALPSAIAATAGAFQMLNKQENSQFIESDTLNQIKVTPAAPPQPSQLLRGENKDYVDESYK